MKRFELLEKLLKTKLKNLVDMNNEENGQATAMLAGYLFGRNINILDLSIEDLIKVMESAADDINKQMDIYNKQTDN